MNFVEAMTAAQAGYDTWAAKPHNKKWAKMIYHTPIPNDLAVCIAEAVAAATRAARSVPEAGKAVDGQHVIAFDEDHMPERIWAGDFDESGFGHCVAGMQGGLYAEYVLSSLASSPAPTGAEDDSDLPTAEDVRGILGPAPQAVPAEEIAGDELGKITAALAKANIALAPVADGGGAWHYEVLPLANPPQPVAAAEGEIAGLVRKLTNIADASRRSDGTDIPLGEQVREAAAALTSLSGQLAEAEMREATWREDLTASEAEATDLRRKLEEARRALEPFAALAEASDRLAIEGQRRLQPEASAELSDDEIAALVTPDDQVVMTDGRMAFGKDRHPSKPVRVTMGDLRRARALYVRITPAGRSALEPDNAD